MSRTVFCEKLQRDSEGLSFVPWPGALGKRVYDGITPRSLAAMARPNQTMLINENRLSPMNPKDRAFLETEMEKFLFAGGAEKPQGYVPPEA